MHNCPSHLSCDPTLPGKTPTTEYQSICQVLFQAQGPEHIQLRWNMEYGINRGTDIHTDTTHTD